MSEKLKEKLAKASTKNQTKKTILPQKLIWILLVFLTTLALIAFLITQKSQTIEGNNNIQTNSGDISITKVEKTQTKSWMDYSLQERRLIKAECHILFPDIILAPLRKKNWSKVHNYLQFEYGIQNNSPRDLFRSKKINNFPAYFSSLLSRIDDIYNQIGSLKDGQLRKGWDFPPAKTKTSRLNQWLKLVENNAVRTLGTDQATVYMDTVHDKINKLKLDDKG